MENKEIIKRIAEEINKAENIVVTAHISEDADACGSVFALGTALKNAGKKVTVYLSGEPEERLKFLRYEYAVFDEGASVPQDLVICLDSADLGRLGTRKELLEKSLSISIDHHCTNTNYADINYVEGGASSTGELIYILLKEMGTEITREIAEFLYVSISGDTGSFKYSCTSARTMRIAADLLETGIDHAELARRLYETEKIETVRLKGYIMSNILSFFGGKLRMAVLDKDTFERFGVLEKNAGDIVNIPRMIEGTEIAVSVRETPEKIKISFRSNGKYNVSDIAANFGGGGHVMAAGASVSDMTLKEVCEKVKEYVGVCIND